MNGSSNLILYRNCCRNLEFKSIKQWISWSIILSIEPNTNNFSLNSNSSMIKESQWILNFGKSPIFTEFWYARRSQKAEQLNSLITRRDFNQLEINRLKALTVQIDQTIHLIEITPQAIAINRVRIMITPAVATSTSTLVTLEGLTTDGSFKI